MAASKSTATTSKDALRSRKPAQAQKPEEVDSYLDSVKDDEDEAEGPQAAIPSGKKRGSSTKSLIDDEDRYGSWLDVLRVLSGLFVASCLLSYLISDGESFFWGMKNPPWWMKLDYWKGQFNGPLYLTPAQLALYDGTDESKPIYLAINGTIYDVTVGRRIYGPGGSYNVFAGVDASRGYVTGCFGEDRTPDMRGVREMFLPLDDPETDKHWSPAELKELKKRELEDAKKKTYEALKHWVDFFAKSKKYHFVGYVKRPKGWLQKEPKRKLCDVAQQGRTKRHIPGSS